MIKTPRLSISVVSHGQAALVEGLLSDLARIDPPGLEVTLTLNIDEELPSNFDVLPFVTHLIRNQAPKGFGANHNAAFKASSGAYFCIVNPDIRLRSDPFPALLGRLTDKRLALIAPRIEAPTGATEDSARRFPTPMTIFLKALGKNVEARFPVVEGVMYPDWVGGMFMVVRREAFAEMGGFDERYFLYYEDVDLCARLRLAGYKVGVEVGASAVHHARRDSHRKVRYLRWHLSSMLRFFTSRIFFSALISRRKVENS